METSNDDTNRISAEALASRAISIWRIYYSLLQAHRSLFVSCQAILLSFTSVLLALGGNVGAMLAMILASMGFVVLFASRRSLRDRLSASLYWQLLLLRIEAGEEVGSKLYTEFSQFRSSQPLTEQWKAVQAGLEAKVGKGVYGGGVSRFWYRNGLNRMFVIAWILVVVVGVLKLLGVIPQLQAVSVPTSEFVSQLLA